MCDYSLQTVKSRPARVGERLTTHSLQYLHDRIRRSPRYRHGSLRSSGNGTCLCQDRNMQATRVVCVETESDRSHHGYLPADQQRQPANPS